MHCSSAAGESRWGASFSPLTRNVAEGGIHSLRLCKITPRLVVWYMKS